MSKLRVHDMAGEFGISADEVIALLRQMDVPVRSHLSLLTDDQVSRIRARWEREKRVRAEKAQPAPAAAPRRRRTAATEAAPAPEVEAAAPAAPPAVRRRRAADV
ncbi:translation initiation factor IF-2 N-terminal domain-containing protein, partial [Gemmatimonas sp.]